MRSVNKNLNIVSYAQHHQIDISKIKIRQPNHLFDVNSSKKNSNKRVHIDNQVLISTDVREDFLRKFISISILFF